jgi:hypothetical protein
MPPRPEGSPLAWNAVSILRIANDVTPSNFFLLASDDAGQGVFDLSQSRADEHCTARTINGSDMDHQFMVD